MKIFDFNSNEFQLKEENEKLKHIIKKMREDMENIAFDPTQAIQTKSILNEEILSPNKENSISNKIVQIQSINTPRAINDHEQKPLTNFNNGIIFSFYIVEIHTRIHSVLSHNFFDSQGILEFYFFINYIFESFSNSRDVT